jgi:hypothetical protein
MRPERLAVFRHLASSCLLGHVVREKHTGRNLTAWVAATGLGEWWNTRKCFAWCTRGFQGGVDRRCLVVLLAVSVVYFVFAGLADWWPTCSAPTFFSSKRVWLASNRPICDEEDLSGTVMRDARGAVTSGVNTTPLITD